MGKAVVVLTKMKFFQELPTVVKSHQHKTNSHNKVMVLHNKAMVLLNKVMVLLHQAMVLLHQTWAMVLLHQTWDTVLLHQTWFLALQPHTEEDLVTTNQSSLFFRRSLICSSPFSLLAFFSDFIAFSLFFFLCLLFVFPDFLVILSSFVPFALFLLP